MKKVLVFDSGVGGFSIVRELLRMNLMIDIDYLADTSFFPYGNKNDLELLERIPKIVAQGVINSKAEAVIIACNTASTIALWRIRELVQVPVIGVVPAIKPAAKLSKTKTIGLLATPRTIGSAYVDGLCEHFAADCRVIRYGPPNLALAAEEKLRGEEVEIEHIKDAIDGLYKNNGAENIDIIVLACTHYPLVIDELKGFTPKNIKFVDSGEAIARRLKSVLALDAKELAGGGILNCAYSSGGNDANFFKAAKELGFHDGDVLNVIS